jgi:hypothetical protein
MGVFSGVSHRVPRILALRLLAVSLVVVNGSDAKR